MSEQKSKVISLYDGVRNFVSQLVDSRNAITTNTIYSRKLSQVELREIYRHGIANKIVRLKAGAALKDTLQFDSEEDRKFYERRLQKDVKRATKWMIAFGRGIIVLHERGDDLSRPLGAKPSADKLLFSVFGGDLVTVSAHDNDLQSPRYYKPSIYQVRGAPVHYSRVIDFTYIEPPEVEKPHYFFGGISEFEMIHEQIVADGIVQRSSPRVIEKASTLFYKVKGFRSAMQMGQEKDMVEYFQRLEDVRGINAAGILDAEDELEVVQQTISNLSEADQITLRRLSMVSGISVTRLVGEAPKGMNASGENEKDMDQDMIEALQSDYLLEPINELMTKCGKGQVWFKDNQGETANDRMDFETKAIINAKALYEMGEDHTRYLEDKDIITRDDFDSIFAPPAPDNADDETARLLGDLLGDDNGEA